MMPSERFLSSSSRRESIDSGLSLSPITHSNPMSPTEHRPKKKKKKRLMSSLSAARFRDLYQKIGDVLGEGSYGKVNTCVNIYTGVEYAVKTIDKHSWAFSRSKIMKEIELYYLCQGHQSIIQLVEYFEEPDCFYLIFEKAKGGPLLSHIQKRITFSETEAAAIIKDLASALNFLHSKGIAHRDIKPENILCMDLDTPCTIKLCDFDLCSNVNPTVSTPKLQSPVGSAEYMSPEVVDAFEFDDLLDLDEDEDNFPELTYDKSCDIWSMGIIAYILLCGYLPFNGRCGEDCGWDDRNEECPRCQQRLFSAIKRDALVFPEQHWSHISPEAKDLISQLLVRDPSCRLRAEEILEHPWIVNGGVTTSLNNTQKEEEEEANEATEVLLEPLLPAHSDKVASNKEAQVNSKLKKAATSVDLWSSVKQPQPLKASAKMRRQSSVVNFYPKPEDMWIRCEF